MSIKFVQVSYWVKKFFERKSAGGYLLLLAVIIAMVWANSPWKESYKKIGFESKEKGYNFTVLNECSLEKF